MQELTIMPTFAGRLVQRSVVLSGQCRPARRCYEPRNRGLQSPTSSCPWLEQPPGRPGATARRWRWYGQLPQRCSPLRFEHGAFGCTAKHQAMLRWWRETNTFAAAVALLSRSRTIFNVDAIHNERKKSMMPSAAHGSRGQTWPRASEHQTVRARHP